MINYNGSIRGCDNVKKMKFTSLHMYSIAFIIVFLLLLSGCSKQYDSIYEKIKKVTSYRIEKTEKGALEVIFDTDTNGKSSDFMMVRENDDVLYYYFGEKEQYSIMLLGQTLKITEVKNINTQNSGNVDYEAN